jgi:hypothetical protein
MLLPRNMSEEQGPLSLEKNESGVSAAERSPDRSQLYPPVPGVMTAVRMGSIPDWASDPHAVNLNWGCGLIWAGVQRASRSPE